VPPCVLVSINAFVQYKIEKLSHISGRWSTNNLWVKRTLYRILKGRKRLVPNQSESIDIKNGLGINTFLQAELILFTDPVCIEAGVHAGIKSFRIQSVLPGIQFDSVPYIPKPELFLVLKQNFSKYPQSILVGRALGPKMGLEGAVSVVEYRAEDDLELPITDVRVDEERFCAQHVGTAVPSHEIRILDHPDRGIRVPAEGTTVIRSAKNLAPIDFLDQRGYCHHRWGGYHSFSRHFCWLIRQLRCTGG
jgi:hypothetical protein